MSYDIRRRVKRLENRMNPSVWVLQQDGSYAHFRESDLQDAYVNLMDRMRYAGTDDMPPEHPMMTAVRNSPDPKYRVPGTMWADLMMEEEDDSRQTETPTE
jgi:hypothetical protein